MVAVINRVNRQINYVCSKHKIKYDIIVPII